MIRPRTWRSVPSNFCTRRFASAFAASEGSGLPSANHRQREETGHWPQRGDRAVQTTAPSSMREEHIPNASSRRDRSCSGLV